MRIHGYGMRDGGDEIRGCRCRLLLLLLVVEDSLDFGRWRLRYEVGGVSVGGDGGGGGEGAAY